MSESGKKANAAMWCIILNLCNIRGVEANYDQSGLACAKGWANVAHVIR